MRPGGSFKEYGYMWGTKPKEVLRWILVPKQSFVILGSPLQWRWQWASKGHFVFLFSTLFSVSSRSTRVKTEILDLVSKHETERKKYSISSQELKEASRYALILCVKLHIMCNIKGSPKFISFDKLGILSQPAWPPLASIVLSCIL